MPHPWGAELLTPSCSAPQNRPMRDSCRSTPELLSPLSTARDRGFAWEKSPGAAPRDQLSTHSPLPTCAPGNAGCSLPGCFKWETAVLSTPVCCRAWRGLPAWGQHCSAGQATTGQPWGTPVPDWGKPPCAWIWDHLYFLPFQSPSLLSPLSQPQLLDLQDFVQV